MGYGGGVEFSFGLWFFSVCVEVVLLWMCVRLLRF